MPRSRNTEGAIYMSMAMAGFSASDALSKSVISYMNAGEIMFLRGHFTSILVYLIAWKFGALRPWRVMVKPIIALRIACEIIAAVTYITALGMMPIANASAILQPLPLVVTFGAALFFREPVGWRRWMAILVGLVGVMIIIRPGPEGFTAAALLCVASVASTAGRDLATRSISKDIPSLMITTVTAISVAIFGALMIPFLGGWEPVGATSLTHLLLASVLVLVGYQSVIVAMRTGEISFVAPFRYTSLIFSSLLGFFFFAELPDFWTLVGAAIVIASGLYTFYREAKRHVPPVAQGSAPRSPV